MVKILQFSDFAFRSVWTLLWEASERGNVVLLEPNSLITHLLSLIWCKKILEGGLARSIPILLAVKFGATDDQMVKVVFRHK